MYSALTNYSKLHHKPITNTQYTDHSMKHANMLYGEPGRQICITGVYIPFTFWAYD